MSESLKDRWERLYPRMNNRGNNINLQNTVNSVHTPQTNIRAYIPQKLAGVSLPSSKNLANGSYLFIATIENGSIIRWRYLV